jgi:hypothetical protein
MTHREDHGGPNRVHGLLGDGVANDILQEDLEHATRLLCATRDAPRLGCAHRREGDGIGRWDDGANAPTSRAMAEQRELCHRRAT